MINLKTAISGICVTAALIAAADVSLAEESVSELRLAVVENRPGGNAVLQGNYSRALTEISRRDEDRFSSVNNLCVAHALMGDFAKAELMCGEAIEVGAKRTTRDEALALSNAAVLSAMNGDLELAKVRLEASVALDSDLTEPTLNYRALNRRF